MSGVIRATRAEINLDALRNNFEIIKNAIPGGTAVCAAVKANAYGHGDKEISAELRSLGAEYLGVSSPYEGIKLREAGDTGKIVLFGPTVAEEIPLSITAGLELFISDGYYLEKVIENAKLAAGENFSEPGRNSLLKKFFTASRDKTNQNKAGFSAQQKKFPVPLHLKIDTGMGRVGCSIKEAPELAKKIAESPYVFLAGISSHLPSADSIDPEDIEFTEEQGRIFAETVNKIKKMGIEPGIRHIANSGAIATNPELAFNMVRSGIALYGYGLPITPGRSLVPVMKFMTKVTSVKKIYKGMSVSYGRTWTAVEDTYTALLPVGYADGYFRNLSNKAEVLINGKRYPVIGRICMDQTIINIGKKDPRSSGILPGTEVTLFGADKKGPDAQEIADLSGTIPYEVTCAVSARVPRVYIKNSK